MYNVVQSLYKLLDLSSFFLERSFQIDKDVRAIHQSRSFSNKICRSMQNSPNLPKLTKFETLDRTFQCNRKRSFSWSLQYMFTTFRTNFALEAAEIVYKNCAHVSCAHLSIIRHKIHGRNKSTDFFN